MVAGELTTESFLLRASISGSSRGFDDAEVAICDGKETCGKFS